MSEESKVYLGNLEYTVTEEDLKALFADKELEVVSLNLITDKFSGKFKGFGFAEFETPELASDAVSKLDGVDLKGRGIRASIARPKREFNDRR